MIVLATVHAESPLAVRLIERFATPADTAYVARRNSPAARHLSLLARASLRAILVNQTGRREWQICADSRGKLSIRDAMGRAGDAICLAHTRGIVACAVGNVRALGVDIEGHRTRDFSAIAERSFGPRECVALRRGGAPAFYRIWTLREAIGKATGEGLQLVTDRRDRIDGAPYNGIWQQCIDENNWVLGHFELDGGTSVAVAGMLERDQAVDTQMVGWLDPATL